MAGAELFYREPSGGYVPASAADVAVLRAYPTAPERGAEVAGRRITLLAEKAVVAVGEEVHVIHVVEIEGRGQELYVMGPKPVLGEYLDGALATAAPGSVGAFTTAVYDGAVMPSPGVDTNFDVTRYTFTRPGVHTLTWRDGPHVSNALCIEVR